jgi:hypothetical protein
VCSVEQLQKVGACFTVTSVVFCEKPKERSSKFHAKEMEKLASLI